MNPCKIMTEQERFDLFFLLLKKIYFNEKEKIIKKSSDLGLWLPIDLIVLKYGEENRLKLLKFFKRYSKAGSFSKQTQTIAISFEGEKDVGMQAKDGTKTNVEYSKTMNVCQIKLQFLYFMLDFLFDMTTGFDTQYGVRDAIGDFNRGNITFKLKKEDEQKDMAY